MLDGLLQSVCYAGDLSGQYLAQRTAVSIFPVNEWGLCAHDNIIVGFTTTVDITSRVCEFDSVKRCTKYNFM